MNNKMLLIVDPQYDFLEGGSLGVNGATEKMDKLTEHIEQNEYDIIVFTCDWHPINHSSFKTNGNGTWPVHCVQHTHGAAIYQPLFNAAINNCKNVRVLTKGDIPSTEEYSIMANYLSGKAFLRYVAANGIKEINVCGIANEFCVKNTVKDIVESGLKDKLNVMFDFIAAINDESVLKNYVAENALKSV